MDTHTEFRRTFLIVDDEALVRSEISDLVRDAGFQAREAGSTAEALGILEAAADSFFGLITDINMPGTRSGVVLAHHVRTMWPHMRVVVMSAGRKPFAGELPEQASFIAKPWRVDELTSVISH